MRLALTEGKKKRKKKLITKIFLSRAVPAYIHPVALLIMMHSDIARRLVDEGLRRTCVGGGIATGWAGGLLLYVPKYLVRLPLSSACPVPRMSDYHSPLRRTPSSLAPFPLRLGVISAIGMRRSRGAAWIRPGSFNLGRDRSFAGDGDREAYLP